MPTCPPPKRPVVGSETPPSRCIHPEPPSCPQGRHRLCAASEHPCLQPSDSLPKLVEERRALPPLPLVSPVPWPSYLFSCCIASFLALKEIFP